MVENHIFFYKVNKRLSIKESTHSSYPLIHVQYVQHFFSEKHMYKAIGLWQSFKQPTSKRAVITVLKPAAKLTFVSPNKQKKVYVEVEI